MSRLSFYCAVCGHSLTVGSESAGSLVECPSCERLIPVPGWRPQPHAPAGCLGVLPPDLLAVDFKFLCPHCRTKLKVDARWAGQTVACPQCSVSLPVPVWCGEAHLIRPMTEATNQAGERATPLVELSPEEMSFLGATPEGR